MNVHKSTKILEFICTDNFLKLAEEKQKKILEDFLEINENLKPESFRNKQKDVFLDFVYNINKELKKALKKDLNAYEIIKIEKGSDDNTIGSDALVLYRMNKNEDIQLVNLELKFGNETLRNIGSLYMDKIFNLDKLSEWNFQNFNKYMQKEQRKFVENNVNINEDELIKNLDLFLTKEIKRIKLIKSLKINNIKINQEKILNSIKTTGGEKVNINKLIKYKISIDKTIEKIFIYDGNKIWKTLSFEKSLTSARIEIICSDGEWDLKFLLNWKNNKKYLNKKWVSKCGLGTSSWNVWKIKRKID